MATSDRPPPLLVILQRWKSHNSCFALIGTHQCDILMECSMTSHSCIHLVFTLVEAMHKCFTGGTGGPVLTDLYREVAALQR